MKKDEQRGWQVVRWRVGLAVANGMLLILLLNAPELSGLKGFFFYGAVLLLCAADVAAVYLLIRKLMRGKK